MIIIIIQYIVIMSYVLSMHMNELMAESVDEEDDYRWMVIEVDGQVW